MDGAGPLVRYPRRAPGPSATPWGTVADTLRAGADPIDWKEWARTGTRSGVLAGLGHLVGHPEVGRIAGAVPAAATLAGEAMPRVATPLLLSPTAS